jgi:hypothetical protein
MPNAAIPGMVDMAGNLPKRPPLVGHDMNSRLYRSSSFSGVWSIEGRDISSPLSFPTRTS